MPGPRWHNLVMSAVLFLSVPAVWGISATILLLAAYMAANLLGKRKAAVRRYAVRSNRIAEPFRILLISDLHSSRYGSGMEPILRLAEAEKPDCILLGGDLYHYRGKTAAVDAFLSRLPSLAPCCMVLGNHEKRRKDVPEIRQKIVRAGIRLLSGENARFPSPRISISGVEDFGHKMPLHTLAQLRTANRKLSPDEFHILLVHRPDLVPLFLRFDYDLILCGHTHGGQWRLPAHPSGLFAPGQGIFPKYAGGEYRFQHARMIISRGLSKKPWWAARIGNPPEVCVIDLSPDPQECASR